jgi:hypothetical protein
MIRTTCCLVFVCALAAPASAQQEAAPAPEPIPAPTTAQWPLVPSISDATLEPTLVVSAAQPSVVALALPPTVVASRPTVVASAFRRKDQDRPAALVPLYASFATLQALDYASTMRALAGGAATEANPVMRSIVGNRAAFIAVKAGATAGVILAGEKMWKRNRVAAVVFVAAVNGAVAAIVARNYALR